MGGAGGHMTANHMTANHMIINCTNLSPSPKPTPDWITFSHVILIQIFPRLREQMPCGSLIPSPSPSPSPLTRKRSGVTSPRACESVEALWLFVGRHMSKR